MMRLWIQKSLILMMALTIPAISFGASFGEVADNLMKPTELVTNVIMVVCYIVGIALLLSAFAQYKIHRQNPKLVPLTTPIVLIVLGLVAMLIPYTTTVFGPTFSATEEAKKRPKETTTLPLPDATGKRGPTLPLPGRENAGARDSRPDKRPTAPPPTKKPRKGSGHWTDDAQYN